MILTSGVLVFAAAALLVDGVFFTSGQSGTPWQIWASIVVSAAAALLLVAGAVRERAQRPATAGGPAEPPAPTPSRDELRIASPSQATTTLAAPAAEPVAQPAPPPPTQQGGFPPAAPVERVLVVAGRPRYHLAGCRYVADRGAQELGVAEARAAGYTACGVCRPDDGGAATAGTATAGTATPDGAAADTAAAEPEMADPAREPGGRPDVAPGPVGLPPAAEPSAPPAPAAASTVVLVRGRYHRPDCRYVAVAAERREVSRGEARDAGALPCGVCRP